MLEEFWLKLSMDGAVSFLMEILKRGFETSHHARENRALIREARTLWGRKCRLEQALSSYCMLEAQFWAPTLCATLGKKLTVETVRRRTRKESGLPGPFMTGQPTSYIAESAIRRHKTTILSSAGRNKALREIIEMLRAHLLELAASVAQWDELEQFYCKKLAGLEALRKRSPLALKRRLRKAARDRKPGSTEKLMTGNRALRLAKAPSRVLE